MPHMTHPDSEQEIEVRADQVQTYRSQGWVVASRKPAKPAPETKPTHHSTSA